MTASQVIDSTHQSFSGTFFNALVEAIAEASESPWLIAAVADAAPASDDSEPVRIKLTLDGSLPGDFLLEFRRADAALLVSKCLRQPVEEFSDEQAASLLKLVESGIGKVPSALEPSKPRWPPSLPPRTPSRLSSRLPTMTPIAFPFRCFSIRR